MFLRTHRLMLFLLVMRSVGLRACRAQGLYPETENDRVPRVSDGSSPNSAL